MPDVRTRSSWLTRDVILLSFCSLFADVSTEMLYPILPLFLTGVLGAGGSVVGLIDGVAQATQNIVQGFSGWASDRMQRRKPIALAGYLLSAVSKPLTGIATAWPMVLGARFLDRVGAGTRSAPRDALIAASASEEHRGKAFGLEGVGDNLGAFLGPLIAVLLLGAFRVDMRVIFYLTIIPGLLAFAMVLFVREQRVDFAAKAKVDINLRRFPRAYWKYLLATGLFCIGNSSNAFLILETQSAGASVGNTVLVYAGFNLVAALVSYPTGFLSDRLGRRNLLLTSFAVFFVAYGGFALTVKVWLVAILFVCYGAYQGTSALSVRRSPPISCRASCGRAASAGTVRSSG
ncbi:MFS transporter [Mesorhizobium captivum]|uniref:MFS transporter n=1 Tax=Mesorhizobium captivum TaxID=3072319 RepID=UPI002A23BC5B|nr:MFS transporter [Mesorhizobium sp. VK3C]MDX8450459.1 MFS transporter [Mesorhizobium sp. VK3C]